MTNFDQIESAFTTGFMVSMYLVGAASGLVIGAIAIFVVVVLAILVWNHLFGD